MAKKHFYGNRINLAGLYSKEPVKLTYREKTDMYHSSDDGLIISSLGYDETDTSCITFLSEDRKEAHAFTLGVLATLTRLRGFANFVLNK